MINLKSGEIVHHRMGGQDVDFSDELNNFDNVQVFIDLHLSLLIQLDHPFIPLGKPPTGDAGLHLVTAGIFLKTPVQVQLHHLADANLYGSMLLHFKHLIIVHKTTSHEF